VLVLVFLMTFALVASASGERLAAPAVPAKLAAPAVASPGLFKCKPVTAANELSPPPPLTTTPAEQALVKGAKRPCPEGQVADPVPVGRGAKHGFGGKHPVASSGQDPMQEAAGAAAPPESAEEERCKAGGCYWYAESEYQKFAIGEEYTTAISEPAISDFPGAHSVDQLGVGGGLGGNTNTMEEGFDVDHSGIWPSLPNNPHLFIFVNHDKYTSESDCYDCNFVPAQFATIVPGEAFEPTKTKISLAVRYYQGNWWVWAGQWLGYVEGSFWSGKFTKGSNEAVWGEVYDAESGPTSQMGNGLPGSNSEATAMTAPVVFKNETENLSTKLQATVTNAAYYSIGSVNSTKTEWHFGGSGIPRPADPPWAFRESSGNQDVFFRGSDGALYQQEWTAATGWKSSHRIGGLLTSDPMGYIEPNGTMNIFYRGGNDAIWQFYRDTNGAWTTQELGGSAAGRPFGYIQSGGAQNVFYRGTNNVIWQLYYDPSTGWHNISLGGEPAGGDPVAFLQPNGYQNVFYVTTNGGVGQLWWRPSDGWHNSPLGGSNQAVGVPTAYLNGSTQNVFFRTGEGKMGQWWYRESDGWHDSPLGGAAGSVTGNPFAFTSPGGQQHVYFRNQFGTIGEWLYEEASGWKSKELGESASSDPGGFSQPNGNLNVFFFESGTNSLDQWFYNGTWNLSTICAQCG